MQAVSYELCDYSCARVPNRMIDRVPNRMMMTDGYYNVMVSVTTFNCAAVRPGATAYGGSCLHGTLVWLVGLVTHCTMTLLHTLNANMTLLLVSLAKTLLLSSTLRTLVRK